MSIFLSDTVLDAALEVVRLSDQIVICEGQPASYAEATTDKGSGGVALGEVAVDSSDYTIANGDTSGRKVTSAQQAGVAIDVSGDADHYAHVDTGTSALLMVTTGTLQAVVSGNTATIGAHKLELLDAAAA